MIARSEAIRLARELGVDPARLRDTRGLPPAEIAAVDEGSCDKLCQLLREGRGQQARILIHSIASSGCGAVTLADHLIRPAMARIGHGWMAGALDVYHEHQASHIVASSIMELIERVSRERPASGPVALGATTEGDPYLLSTLLAELVLREMGWQVHNLGVNLPLKSLANATCRYRPKLVFLSINYLRNEDHFAREYRSFYETAAQLDTAVIIGGQALGAELRSRLIYTAFGDRMIHLAEFARQLTLATDLAGQAPGLASKAIRRAPRSSHEAAQ